MTGNQMIGHGDGHTAAVRVLIAVATHDGLAGLAGGGDRTLSGWVRSTTLELCFPLVFSHHTRSLERRRGHPWCQRGIGHLEPGCHDRFTDDVLAVAQYVLTFCNQPVDNLPGWIVSRIGKATVDGHRRRRGETGALQRPRLPHWLDAGLGHDPWLCALAVLILEWVGIPTPAGAAIWPLDGWQARRTLIDPARRTAIDTDVDHVLQVMRRTRPLWFQRYVEGPLGRKPAPAIGVNLQHLGGLTTVDLSSTDPDEERLTCLATTLISAVRDQVGVGGSAATVAAGLLRTVARQSDDPAMAARLADPRRRREVTTVLADLAG